MADKLDFSAEDKAELVIWGKPVSGPAANEWASETPLGRVDEMTFVLFQAVDWLKLKLQNRIPGTTFTEVAALISFSPLVLLFLPNRPETAISYAWLMLVCSWSTLALAFSHHMREVALDVRPGLLQMLAPARESVEFLKLEEWFATAQRVPRQLLFVGVGAALVIGMALRLPSPTVERAPAVILSLAIAGAVGGHALYGVVLTATFCRRVASVPNMALEWTSPIDTAGLQGMGRLVRTEAQLGLVLLPVTALPLIYGYVQTPDSQVKRLYLVLMGLPLLCLAVIGWLAQVWICEPAHRARSATLREIATRNELIKSVRDFTELGADELREVSEGIQAYSTLKGMQQSFVRTDSVAMYLSASLAAAIPLAVAFLAR